MKWISSAIILLLLNLIQPVAACTCFGSGNDDGKVYILPTLVVMSCENNICQQAVEVIINEPNALNIKYSDTNFDTAVNQYMTSNSVMILGKLKYPANVNDQIPSAQTKYPQLNGVYKILYTNRDSLMSQDKTFFGIIQVSDKPNANTISDLANRYKAAIDKYNNYRMSGMFLSATVHILLSISIFLYVLMLVLTSFYLSCKKVITPEMQNLIFTNRNYLYHYGISLTFIFLAMLSPSLIMYLQDSFVSFADYYKLTTTIYVAVFAFFAILVCCAQYEFGDKQYQQKGFFAAIFALKNAMVIVGMASLTNLFGMLLASQSTPVAVPLFYIAGSFVLLSIPLLLYSDGVKNLDETQKSAYIKLHAKVILWLTIIPSLIATMNMLRYYSNSYYNLYSLISSVSYLYLLITIPVMLIYLIRMYQLRISFGKIMQRTFIIIICFFLFVAFSGSSCNCEPTTRSDWDLNQRIQNQYFNYAKENNIKI